MRGVGPAHPDRSEVVVTADLEPGVPVRIVKYATYQTSRAVAAEELASPCLRTLDRVKRDGSDELLPP